MSRSARGFTLIELIVAVAIVAILMAIAIPSYAALIGRAARSEAMTAMTRVAAAQERFFFTYGRYASSLTAPKGSDPASAGLDFPSDTTAEDDSDERFYTLTLELFDDGLRYELSAEPAGVQAQDSCGTLTLDSAGSRGANSPDCW